MGISSTFAIRIKTEREGLINSRSICEIYPGVTSDFMASSFAVSPFSIRALLFFRRSFQLSSLSCASVLLYY